MKLGTEVDLGPGHIVLDGDPALHPQGYSNSLGPCLLWPNSWMDQDATSTKVDIGPGDIVLDGDPAP